MKPAAPLKELVSVGELLRRRLKETKRTPEELAEAVELSPEYVADLISGDRRPPLPGRTDIYERMTRFLGLGRTDLASCANAERADTRKGTTLPEITVRRALLDICDPVTAKELERRAKKSPIELIDLFQRVLDVAQASVRRMLDDPIALRLAATKNGSEYIPMRLRVLEFLDVNPSTLTMTDLTNWVLPRIGRWDVDLSTGVLRVILRTQEAPEQNRRRPTVGGRRGRLG
jgi:transcriptional regulator with XRE-family HTH domain